MPNYFKIGQRNQWSRPVSATCDFRISHGTANSAHCTSPTALPCARIGQAVLELLSFKVASGNHQRGISLLQNFSETFGNMRLVSLRITSHLIGHNFQRLMQVSISSKTILPGTSSGTRLEGSKTLPSGQSLCTKTLPPGQSLCTKTLPSGQNRMSKAPPPGHKIRKFHKSNQSSDILQHSQNRPTRDRWLKF